METGIYKIEFFDGSKWNLHFANSTQKNNVLRNINDNKDLVKSFHLIINGIHPATQVFQIFNEIKNRKNQS